MIIVLATLMMTGCTPAMMQNFSCKMNATRVVGYPGGAFYYTPGYATSYCNEKFPASGKSNTHVVAKTPADFQKMKFGDLHE